MKRGRPSGWQLYNHRMQRLPVMPEGESRWERLLYRLEIPAAEAPLVILRGGPKAKELKEWIHRYGDSAYVPSAVLEVVGWSSRWDA